MGTAAVGTTPAVKTHYTKHHSPLLCKTTHFGICWTVECYHTCRMGEKIESTAALGDRLSRPVRKRHRNCYRNVAKPLWRRGHSCCENMPSPRVFRSRPMGIKKVLVRKKGLYSSHITTSADAKLLTLLWRRGHRCCIGRPSPGVLPFTAHGGPSILTDGREGAEVFLLKKGVIFSITKRVLKTND
eukprot:jgi/Botrbrau1/1992/Bobra.0052s0034.1